MLITLTYQEEDVDEEKEEEEKRSYLRISIFV